MGRKGNLMRQQSSARSTTLPPAGPRGEGTAAGPGRQSPQAGSWDPPDWGQASPARVAGGGEVSGRTILALSSLFCGARISLLSLGSCPSSLPPSSLQEPQHSSLPSQALVLGHRAAARLAVSSLPQNRVLSPYSGHILGLGENPLS